MQVLKLPLPALIFTALTLLFSLSSCDSGGNKSGAQAEEATAEAAPPSPAFPSIPDSTMRMLWERCDYIDYIFYNLSFSMSQDRQQDIRQSLQHISTATPELRPDCRAIGRIFYQVEGENVLEADIFYNQGCQYYIFYREGRQTYANLMTPQGIQFYERVFSMVNQTGAR